ncbi:hypothetical protein [Cognatilysobacter bugurensis]|uniref:Uncharacterized protein n=1 Tax=Cognatilysobacter bugurensis TaxID=543356 RepID=A0A918SYA0_9GAMM|nr:hypothetical protein [Lysobacter bugurensis]GHA78872.1 hypothetical protein GCM10007067_15360 [Lysobacter bugurensis]
MSAVVRDRSLGKAGYWAKAAHAMSRALPSGATLAALLAASPAWAAEPQFDFLLFPAVSWHETDVGSGSPGSASGFAATLDLFATVESERVRFLGEWFLTENSKEIQRLQLGWRFSGGDTLWAGRFHTPIGYWNTAYHHGTYLQTSISRPGIEEFEGGHGPLPTHFTGLLWEGSAELATGAMHYSLAAGLGPRLADRLDAHDVAHPDSGHGSGAIVNVNWRPALFVSDQVGMFLGSTRLRGHADGHAHDHAPAGEHTFEQHIAGAYTNWTRGPLRITSTLAHVRGSFEHGGPSESFSTAYVQVEWSASQRLTPYARVEDSHGVDPDAPFLGRFRGFVTERNLIGLRVDLTPRQALTAELSHFDTLGGRGDRLALQWSAYFP